MKRLLFLILLIILYNSCLEEITLKGQRFETDAIVIQGKLVKGSASIMAVTVQRIGDFAGFQAAVHISGAKVQLFDESGASIDIPEDFPGRIYRDTILENHPTFQVKTDKSYYLRVLLPNGQLYESDPQALFRVPEIEKINFQKVRRTQPNAEGSLETDDFIEFSLNTALKTAENSKARIRWEVRGVFRLTDDSLKVCYLPDPIEIDEVLIYNGEAFQLERLDSFVLAPIRFNYRFAEGYYLTIVQESLDEASFIYWDNVRKIINRNGNMFDPPPGQISGNFRNLERPDEDVFGFFYPTEQDTLRLFIRPEDLGFPKKHCPFEVPPMGETLCTNCLIATGSTLEKPYYWIE